MITRELKYDADHLNITNYSRNFPTSFPHPLDFCIITNLKQQSPEYQLALFLQSVGDDALKVNAFAVIYLAAITEFHLSHNHTNAPVCPS